MNASVQMIGLEAVKRRLDKVERETKNATAAYAQSIALVDRFVQENFKSQGGKVGGWAPLKQSTIKARRNKKKGSIKILQDNGLLRMNWKHVYDHKSGSLVSGVYYGIFHDSDKPRTSSLPRRRILPTQKEMWPKIKEIFERHIGRSFHD
jgi:phage gpG-like protein